MHLPAGQEMRKESLPAYVSFIPRCALRVSRIGLPSADRSTWPPSRKVCEKQAFQNSVCMSYWHSLPIPHVRFHRSKDVDGRDKPCLRGRQPSGETKRGAVQRPVDRMLGLSYAQAE